MPREYPSSKITLTNTCWAFLSGSAEARHLHDIVFANDVLKKRGVPPQNILVFTDHPAHHLHLSPFGIGNTFACHSLASELSKRQGFEFVVVVVTGHGDPAGISVGTNSSISPTAMTAAIRGCPGVTAGIVVLGQCFAGLFNYIDASTAPPLCVVGATNLNPSLSSLVGLNAPITTSGGGYGLTQWIANVFLVHFFDWMLKPRDVDGDGRTTLMDAYRHAGVYANAQLREMKRNSHTDIELLNKQIAAMSSGPLSPQVQLQKQAAEQKLVRAVESLYLHQEPWILNAYLAASIEF